MLISMKGYLIFKKMNVLLDWVTMQHDYIPLINKSNSIRQIWTAAISHATCGLYHSSNQRYQYIDRGMHDSWWFLAYEVHKVTRNKKSYNSFERHSIVWLLFSDIIHYENYTFTANKLPALSDMSEYKRIIGMI